MTSGVSTHGSTWLCIVLTLPNCAFILPTFSSTPPGSVGNVMKPSSISSPSGDAARKKSARAYGSTIAWKLISASLRRSAGIGATVFRPAAPMKFPITAMSGLKIFDSALTLP